jgi:hypothetical protein
MRKLTMLSKVIVIVILCMPAILKAQTGVAPLKTNPQLKTQPNNLGTVSTQPKTSLIKAGKLAKVEDPKVLKESEINKFPIIRFSPEELERNRVKSWEISPVKPFVSGIELTHWGTFTQSGFKMTPRVRYVINTQYDYYAYSLRLAANLLQGKDYKLVLNVTQENFPSGSTVLFKIGTDEFRLEWPSNRSEIVVLFNNSFTGKQIIDISPVNVPGRGDRIDAKQEYTIKSIRLEELAQN